MMFLPELIDQVIDELQWDKKALISVSLVSRAWILRSRRHLFRTLRLGPFSRYRSSGAGPQVQKFIDLCSHPLSTILDAGPTHVILTTGIETTIEPSLDSLLDRLFDRDYSYKKVIEDHTLAFTNLLSWLATTSGTQGMTNAQRLFKRLRHLALSGLQLEPHQKELIRVFSRPLPTVTQLTIDAELMTFPEIFSAITSSVGSVKRLLIAPRSNPLPVISVSVPVSLPSSLTHIEFGDSYPSILTSIASSSTLERLTFPISHGAEELQATAINEFLESSVAVKNGCLKNCKLVLKPGGNNGDAQTMLIDSLSKILHFHKFKGWTLEADCEAFVHVRIDTIPNVTTVVLQNFKNTEDWALGSLDRILSGLSLFPDLRDVEVPISRSGERDPEMLQRSGWDKVDGTVLEGSEAHYAARIVVRKIRSSLYRCYEKGLLKMRVIYRPRIWFDDWLSLATLQ